jgi:alginate O-acetyltransferase complex protein AlgI
MLFNSLTFLYVFLPIVYVVFWRLTTRKQRHVWLAVTGYVFYSFWDYRFCLLMFFSTAVSYLAGLGLLKWSDPRTRRWCVVVPVILDLSLLGFFKYYNFFINSTGRAMTLFGWEMPLLRLDIILPVGISFYTFHTITYMIDAYRGVITPTRSLWEFMAYVSLFPQLVAGPIVRFRQIEKDLDDIDHANRVADGNIGWSFFAIGLAKKVLIADTLAVIINPALANYDQLSTLSAWLCAIGYSYQLYFDFSGYSDMAVGLGYLFGLRLPQNFNSPYKATDIADFWRRWHISLSSFLRDYLYIPLGGSRGSELRTCRNLMITMLLGGLWHGAGWTFIIWGAYHGVLLSAYRLFGRAWDRMPGAPRRSVTFVLVVIGFTIFRADSPEMAQALITHMFVWQTGASIVGGELLAVMLVTAGAIAHFAPNTFEIDYDWSRARVVGAVAMTALCMLALYGSQPTPFLYFQF